MLQFTIESYLFKWPQITANNFSISICFRFCNLPLCFINLIIKIYNLCILSQIRTCRLCCLFTFWGAGTKFVYFLPHLPLAVVLPGLSLVHSFTHVELNLLLSFQRMLKGALRIPKQRRSRMYSIFRKV